MIRGQTVSLRLFRDEAEISACQALYNQLGERPLTDHTELRSPQRYLADFRQDGLWGADRGTLLVTTRADEPVGLISFSRTTELELSVGYRLWRAVDRGKGYMSEALPLFSAYLFATIPNVTRLALLTAADNAASRRLAEKSGYMQEGVLRQACFYRGRLVDWVLYALLRDEAPRLEELLWTEIGPASG